MNQQLVKVGARYIRDGVHYEVNHIDRTKVVVRKVVGGDAKVFAHGDFDFFLRTRGIELDIIPPDLKNISDEFIDKKNIRLRECRLKIVERILDEAQNYSSRSGENARIIKKIVKEISSEFGMRPRSFSTVAKWVKKFIESNYNPNSLLPSYKLRSSKFKDQVELLIEEKIEKSLISNKRVVKKVLAEEILMELEETLESGVLPSRRTIMRRIDASDPSKHLQNVHGVRQARKLSIAAGQSKNSFRALELVQADGNHLDILLTDEATGEVLSHVYLTLFIDLHTRCILAFHLTHSPFSGYTFLESFKGALNEENGLPGGKIQRLLVDNGSDYISESAKNICNLTKTEIEVAPPRGPNLKAQIERFFRTHNQQFIHQLPGTTFSNPQQKGEYNSEKFACLDIKTMREGIHKFITIYHNSYHLGMNSTPIEMWERAKKRNRIYSYDSKTVNTFAKLTVLRTINKGRIYFEGLRWYSHALRTLELKMQQTHTKQKVQVFIDESDVSRIAVKDPFSDALIQADNVRPHYTTELSLFEHRYITKKQKLEKSESNGLSDTEALRQRIKLRDELWSQLDRNSRKIKSRLTDSNSANLLKQKESFQELVFASEEDLAEQYFRDTQDPTYEAPDDMQAVLISGGLTSNSSETGGADL